MKKLTSKERRNFQGEQIKTSDENWTASKRNNSFSQRNIKLPKENDKLLWTKIL